MNYLNETEGFEMIRLVFGPVCSNSGCQKLKGPTTQRGEQNLLKKGVWTRLVFSVWNSKVPEDFTGLLTAQLWGMEIMFYHINEKDVLTQMAG